MNDTSKEVGISIVKSLFNAIPYVGTALKEAAFEGRRKIKQNRHNTFTELLTEFLAKNHEIKTEIQNKLKIKFNYRLALDSEKTGIPCTANTFTSFYYWTKGKEILITSVSASAQ